MSDYDYELIAHTCSIQEITRVMKEQASKINTLKGLIEPLLDGMDECYADTSEGRELTRRAREATKDE